MQLRKLGTSALQVTPVGLGTWVTGGWMWGGADDQQAMEAIEVSIAKGINLIDTAPVYGFGKSEILVGKAVKKSGRRKDLLLATKCGLEWNPSHTHTGIRRNSSRGRILREVEDSLRRLQTDVIDIYQIHWPDLHTPIAETMETMQELLKQGKIRAIGVSNFNEAQMAAAMKHAPLHSLQPPYNLFERGIEKKILPWCRRHQFGTLTYGALCRGLLSGKFTAQATFSSGDVRSFDPKFEGGNLPQYLRCVKRLQELAAAVGLTVGQLAILWTTAQPGVTCALVGARNAAQAAENAACLNRALYSQTLRQIERIVDEEIARPIGPEFMAPPLKFSFN